MAWVVGKLSVGPPLGVEPVRQMHLQIQNKQTRRDACIWSGPFKMTFLKLWHCFKSYSIVLTWIVSQPEKYASTSLNGEADMGIFGEICW